MMKTCKASGLGIGLKALAPITAAITGAGKEKGLIPLLNDVSGKNVLFCDGEVFFLNRCLLMGASITICLKLQIRK